MSDEIREALRTERTIDITTVGRRSGEPRRIEMWFHNLGDRIFLTGSPGRRGWYANLLADQRMVFHLKQSVVVDLEASARVIVDLAEKRPILEVITERVGATNLAEWLERSPLVEIVFVEPVFSRLEA
jgi:hypothetical protein